MEASRRSGKEADKQELSRSYTRTLGTMKSGDSFGEASFRGNGIRAASIKTRIPSEFLVIEKEDYESIMNSDFALLHFRNDAKRILEFKMMFPIIATLKLDNLPLSIFDFKSVLANQPVVTEGEEEGTIWFIISGSCRILKLVRFYKRQVDKGCTLESIDEQEQLLHRGPYIANKNQTQPKIQSDKYNQKDLVTKLLNIGELNEGDCFGFHRGILDCLFDTKHWQFDSFNSLSDVSIISHSKMQLVGMQLDLI